MSPRFLPLRESGYTDDYHHFRICLPCEELYEVERPDGMSQACGCRRDPDAGIRTDTDESQIESGVESMLALFDRMDVLHAYAAGVLRRLLHELGCPPDVRLSVYLRDLAHRRLDDPTVSRAAMFDDLVDHFAIRLGIGADVLEAARTAAHQT